MINKPVLFPKNNNWIYLNKNKKEWNNIVPILDKLGYTWPEGPDKIIDSLIDFNPYMIDYMRIGMNEPIYIIHRKEDHNEVFIRELDELFDISINDFKLINFTQKDINEVTINKPSKPVEMNIHDDYRGNYYEYNGYIFRLKEDKFVAKFNSNDIAKKSSNFFQNKPFKVEGDKITILKKYVKVNEI